ncbi:MAG: protein arginine kinase [Candidatus Omnitrophica bacterium]|nr:protein arginine kinase [Candidatus Omnitrophota bacterium]
MEINDLLYKESEWLKGIGPKSDIVLSSRVRLARNLADHRFFNQASNEERIKIRQEIMEGFKNVKALKGTTTINIGEISDVDRDFLVERHLMSIEHTEDGDAKAIVFDDKEMLSIMVNEEDHLRIQVLQSGFNILNAWSVINKLDDEIAEVIKYSFSDELGYLTACPTNLGTGLRASLMIHLPALVLTNQVGKVFEAISKLGLTMRGLYGEGTEATGDMFQISNQVTLGHSETELIESIARLIEKIINREATTREMIMTKNKTEVQDKVWRSLGTLKSARIITSNETITLLSVIRMGVNLGIIKGLDLRTVNELFILLQPAHLQKMEKRNLNPEERDRKRAELIREKLKKVEE